MSATMSASTGMPYLNPNDTTVARSRLRVVARERARSPWRELVHVEVEVSITMSAPPRRSPSSSRSAVMPSSSRPLPCSGCGRRAASCRRTSTSSAASRYRIVGRVPRPAQLVERAAQRGEEPARAGVDHHGDPVLVAAAAADQLEHLPDQLPAAGCRRRTSPGPRAPGGRAAPGAGHAGDQHQLPVSPRSSSPLRIVGSAAGRVAAPLRSRSGSPSSRAADDRLGRPPADARAPRPGRRRARPAAA